MRQVRPLWGMLAWLTVLVLSCALAADAPEAIAARLTDGDGDLLVTDAGGVIVGVGRVVAGASFELRILEGFVGPARLTLLRPDGATEVLDVVVNGRILVEGLNLLELLEEWVEAFTVEVNGVAVKRAERRGAEDDGAQGEGPGPGEPSGGGATPGPPGSPGGPNSPGPRGSDGRP